MNKSTKRAVIKDGYWLNLIMIKAKARSVMVGIMEILADRVLHPEMHS